MKIKNQITRSIMTTTIIGLLTACGSAGDEQGGESSNNTIPSDNIVFSACLPANSDSIQNADGSASINILDNIASATYHKIGFARNLADGTPVSVDYMVHQPIGTPKGVVVLFAGGPLDAKIEGVSEGGSVTLFSNNFLIRSAHLFMKQGYRVISLDRPSDFARYNQANGTIDEKPAKYDRYRNSVEHAVDIAGVVRRENAENLKVFFAGVSRGAISAAANNSMANGIALSSANSNLASSIYPVGSAGLPVSRIKRPVHMLMHQADTCNNTLPEYQKDLFDEITDAGIPITGDEVAGGFFDSTDESVCKSLHYHGYLGIETCAVQKITSALDVMIEEFETAAPGNNQPLAFDRVVSGRSSFQLNASDLDDDTLTFAVPYSETALGGTVSVSSTGLVQYSAPAGITGVGDKFVYTLTDGKGGVSFGLVSINL